MCITPHTLSMNIGHHQTRWHYIRTSLSLDAGTYLGKEVSNELASIGINLNADHTDQLYGIPLTA